MGTARKTKDYQAVQFDYSGPTVKRTASDVRAVSIVQARDKMEKAHGPSVDQESGKLMWTVGAKPPTSQE